MSEREGGGRQRGRDFAVDVGVGGENEEPARGGSLPHLAQIQASFGRHDVSGVTAHRSSATSEAARVLGALAFALVDAVGFASTPDLHMPRGGTR